MKIKSLLLTGLFAISAGSQAGNIYVDPVDGDDAKSCKTVKDRCKSIPTAFSKAQEGDTILLKQGTYTFSVPQLNLNKGITIKGGYTATFDDLTRSQDASTTIVKQAENMSEYYRFVYITAGIGKWVVLDGFTIQNFNTKNGSDRGTVLLQPDGGNLSLNNMVMHGNKMNAAGALAIWGTNTAQSDAEIIITNSKFYDNEATSEPAGALYVRTGIKSLTISESSFTGNSSGNNGGALAVNIGNPATAKISLINTTISNNTATSDGGAVYLMGNTTLDIRYSTIVDNKSQKVNGGGGIYSSSTGAVSLMSSIVSANKASGNANDFSGSAIEDKGYNLVGEDGSVTGFVATDKDSSENFTSKTVATAATDFIELEAKDNGGIYSVYTNKLKNGKNKGNPAIDTIPNDGVPFYGVGTHADNPFISLRQAAATVGLDTTHYRPNKKFFFALGGKYDEEFNFVAKNVIENGTFQATVNADGWVEVTGLPAEYADETDGTWSIQRGGMCSGLIPTDGRGLPRSDIVKGTELASACDIGAFEFNDYYNLDCGDEDGFRPENTRKSVKVDWCFNPLDTNLTPQDFLENIGLGAFNWYWSLALLGLLAVRVRKNQG